MLPGYSAALTGVRLQWKHPVASKIVRIQLDRHHFGSSPVVLLQVKVPKPILRIPMLAIHLQRDLSTAGFNPNKQASRDLCTQQPAPGLGRAGHQIKLYFCVFLCLKTPSQLLGWQHLAETMLLCPLQTQCTPLLATSIKQKLEAGNGSGDGAAAASPRGGGAAAVDAADGAAARHHSLLLRLLAKELGCATDDIVDFELNVIDTQPGVIGGG